MIQILWLENRNNYCTFSVNKFEGDCSRRMLNCYNLLAWTIFFGVWNCQSLRYCNSNNMAYIHCIFIIKREWKSGRGEGGGMLCHMLENTATKYFRHLPSLSQSREDFRNLVSDRRLIQEFYKYLQNVLVLMIRILPVHKHNSPIWNATIFAWIPPRL